MNNGIRVSYPRTKYLKLNVQVMMKIQNIINEFMIYAKEAVGENLVYTLDISFDEYEYLDYLSFVFYTSIYAGGAHPDNRIFTISYNAKEDKIITIEDLIKDNSNLLELLSRESRKILSNNPNILDSELLIEGTKEDIANFLNFAFTPTGLMILFPPYQVAPYAGGSFKIVIPYKDLIIK